MESKVTTREKIISCFKDGQTIAIGGQTGHWMPERLIDCILESGARHLTVYSIDTSDPGVGIGRLIRAKVIDRIITTHVGTNPDTNAQIQAGTLQAEFIPIGSWIERIRCGGMGLGGVLTKTGLGTSSSSPPTDSSTCWRPPSGRISPSHGPAVPTPSAIWPTGAAPAGPPTPSWPPVGTCPLWSATTSAIWERSHLTRWRFPVCSWI